MVTRFVLGALLVERVVELVLSRRNAAKAFAQGGEEFGRGHYIVMAIFHGCFFVACDREAGPFEPVRFFALLPLVLGAQGLRYWAIATLGDRWNTRVIVVPGSEPVTSGPYRYMKHPNYLAVCVEMAAVPLMLGAYVTAVLFSVGNAALIFVRVRVEERALGPKWERAFAGKRRLLPGAKRG
jgi:methyltransferase